MTEKTIAFACDHGGFPLKPLLVAQAEKHGWQVQDFGCHTPDSVDYPDMVPPLVDAIIQKGVPFGVLICGTGIGISIAANRFAGIRAALCHDVTTAQLCRQHNNANVLALGARTMGPGTALECLDAFLSTNFEGGRHARRVDKLR